MKVLAHTVRYGADFTAMYDDDKTTLRQQPVKGA